MRTPTASRCLGCSIAALRLVTLSDCRSRRRYSGGGLNVRYAAHARMPAFRAFLPYRGRPGTAARGRLQSSDGPARPVPRQEPEQAFNRVLTRDNPHLTRLKTEAAEAPQEVLPDTWAQPNGIVIHAVDCKNALPAEVEAYVQAGIAASTKRAYRADLDHFQAWGGTVPATDGQIAAYLAAHAKTLSVATLVRRLAAISVAHETHGLPNPSGRPWYAPQCEAYAVSTEAPSARPSHCYGMTCSPSWRPRETA